MDSAAEDARQGWRDNGWYFWSFGAVHYARLLKSSPPIVVAGSTDAELDGKIRKFLKHGRKALDE